MVTIRWAFAWCGVAAAVGSLGMQRGAGASVLEVDVAYAKAYALYIALHQHPELSGSELQTAARVAAELRALGYTVTEHVGGTGVVAIFRNGPGKTVMLRTELDALPVEEKTGLPFASKVHAKDLAGRDVPVGHMCGHDLHMSALVATAGIMVRSRASWQGTLMLVGQPAEETISGAKAMIRDGIFTRFPRPDEVLALHVVNELPAGQVGVATGIYDSNADSLRIASAEAQAAGAPRAPLIEGYETTDAVYNDPALTQRLRAVLEAALAKDKVVTQEPITASEDFSAFVAEGIPGFYLTLGGADPQKYEQAKAAGTRLPSNHSPLFAPDIDPALHTAITAEVAMLRDLLRPGAAGG